jgi:hypothetical protein
MKKQSSLHGNGLVAGMCLVGLFLIGGIFALACTGGATTSELAFAGTWPSCDLTMIDMFWQEYAVTDDSWNPAGIDDACNEAKPFAKVMNAIALIEGAPENTVGTFHDRIDYMRESRSTSSAYHDDFYLRFILDGFTSEASTDPGDHTDLHCPFFDPTNGASVLGERGAVLVHEAWHHWQDRNDFDTSHMDGPLGKCSAGQGACDWFYPHAPGSLLPDGTHSDQIGSLNKFVVVNDVGMYFHSPYQIMAEFESDIAIWGSSAFMPFSIRQEAQNLGNGHLTQNFVNGAAFFIGVPEPFPDYVQRQNP